MILYYLRGTVIHGSQNGHKLGFPTANLDPVTCLALPWEGGWTPALWSYLTQVSTLDRIRKELLPPAGALYDQLLSLAGVYASAASIAGGPLHPGMTNLGQRPSVDDSAAYSIETHLFDYAQDIYGATMELFLLNFIRPVQKFSSFAALSAQLAQDQASAVKSLAILQLKT